MNWHSVNDFLAMGGYGLYVWGSVLVVFLGVALELGDLGCGRRDMLKQLRRSR
jgi:heme exporter protein D